VSDQFFRGDEDNTQPKLAAYFLLGAGLELRWKAISGFVHLINLLNTKYETFGTFANSGTAIEPFLTPGAPLRVVAGVAGGASSSGWRGGLGGGGARGTSAPGHPAARASHTLGRPPPSQ